MPDGQTRGDCYCISQMAAVKENPVLVTTYIKECDSEPEPEPEGGSGQQIRFINALLILPVLLAFK